jgi:hypothetical protein
MIWILVAAVILVNALYFWLKRAERRKGGLKGFPYQKSDALFTPSERSFLGALQLAAGDNAAIFGKVRVADVVEPKEGLSRSARRRAFNRISAKHFDFLLCDKGDLSAACAIELDDASHNPERRQERDEFLKGVCDSAGIKLIRFPAKSGYLIEEVKRLLPRRLVANEPADVDKTIAASIRKAGTNGKICPNCSAPMVKKVAKNGSHAGKTFWACSTFPDCKTVEAIGG